MLRVLAFALVYWPLIPAAAAPDSDFSASLEKALAHERVAGIAWSTVDRDNVNLGAQGHRDAKLRSRLRSDDKVHVGSVTKTFVAVGILRLVSEGKLRLDTPVESVLPGIQFQSDWSATHPVQIRHLLDHTSGLEDARIWHVFSAKNTPDMPLISLFERDPSVLRLRTQPGEVFSYSNMGFTLAAMLIEQTTGERYEKWLERELLEPLSMTDSSFFFVSQTGLNADPRLAWGHLGDGTLVSALPTAVRPAAQLTTTASDMAKFVKFLMGDGAVDGRTLIRSDLLRQMGKVQGTAAAKAGLFAGYALGLVVRDREGSVGYCHQGDTFGYHALLCIYPSEQKAFFLALNSDGDDVDLPQFHKILIRALNLKQKQPAAKAVPIPDLRQWEGYYQPLVSRFAIARYSDLLDGGIAVSSKGDHLVLDRSGKSALELHPIDDHLLRAADRVDISHVLLADKGLQIVSDGQRSYRKVSGLLHYLIWFNLGLGLAGIAYTLFASPVLAFRKHRSIAEPGFVCLFAFLPAGFLLYTLPFSQWGDLTFASMSLCIATALLPVGLLFQIVRAWGRKYRFWVLDIAAACCALQWLIVLAFFGLVPLKLWQ
jgi:CubicO group peptidase (beta-lactamase class C family)